MAVDYYEIGVRQFRQQILPPECRRPRSGATATTSRAPSTPGVHDRGQWTGRCGSNGSTSWWTPTATSSRICCRSTRRCTGQTRRGATAGTRRPTFTATPGPYTGPVPIVTHLHGGHTHEESDGYAEAWYLPRRATSRRASRRRLILRRVRGEFGERKGEVEAGHGGVPVRQRPARRPLWYHDHTLGMTRAQRLRGPGRLLPAAGRHVDLPPAFARPAPRSATAGHAYYEIPLAVQDRSFNADGSLFYPDSREFFDDLPGRTSRKRRLADLEPGVLRQHHGGQRSTWPLLEVEPRRYRFRFLNGCNSPLPDPEARHDPATRPAPAALPFWQIGAEGGFLPRPCSSTSC